MAGIGEVKVQVKCDGLDETITKIRKLKYELEQIKKLGASKRTINKIAKLIIVDMK